MNVGSRHFQDLAESAVAVPSEQAAAGADVGAPAPTLRAHLTRHAGVDQDTSAGREKGFRGLDHLAADLVPQDPGVVHRDSARQDLEVRAADPDGASADEGGAFGRLGLTQLQVLDLLRAGEDDCLQDCLLLR